MNILNKIKLINLRVLFFFVSLTVFETINSQTKISEIEIPDGKAVICVARGSDLRASWCDYPVLLNQRIIFSLKRNTFAYVIVDSGVYSIASTEEYSKGIYFAPITNIYKIDVKPNSFMLLKYTLKLGMTNLLTNLVECDADDFHTLDKKCKRAESNTKLIFKDAGFETGFIMSKENYENFNKGRREQAEKYINNSLSVFYASPTNQNTSQSTDNSQSYVSTFNSSSGSSLGTVVQKGENGRYQVKAKIKCNKCNGSGFTTIGGITSKCPYCHGNGFMGH